MSFYTFCTGAVRLYYRFMFKVEVSGIENVPDDGGYIICPNHKSNHDALIVAAFLPRQLTFLAKYELFKNPITNILFKNLGAIPIKRGENDIGAIKACLGALKRGCGLLIFPQGTRCHELRSEDFKPGTVTMAKKSGVPIIPAGIGGDYKFRRKVSIKFGKPVTPDQIEHLLDGVGGDMRNEKFSNLLYTEINALTR